MSEFVSLEGMKKMTGCTTAGGQCRALDEIGVPYRIRRREVLVLAIHMQAWMEGRHIPRHAEPNLAAVR